MASPTSPATRRRRVFPGRWWEGSRIYSLLWALVAVGVGLALVVQSDQRTRTPGFTQLRGYGRHIDAHAPMHPWGWVFLLLGLLLAGGVLRASHYFSQVALVALFALTFLYAIGILIASVFNGGSWTAVAFSTGIVSAQLVNLWRFDDNWHR